MHINPLTAIDFYKTDHRRQFPKGTTEVYSNFTPRSNKWADAIFPRIDNKVVNYGLQFFLKDFLIDIWNDGFFSLPKDQVVRAYKRRMDTSLGDGAIPVEHIGALHDLGYLPISIKALPEGSRSPIGVPSLTIVNTHPDFFWLTNYLESVMSCYLWKLSTNATTAFEYKQILTKYAKATGTPLEFVQFQAHDFAFRGLSGVYDAKASASGHLTSFWGTDTVLAIDFVEEFYGADAVKELIGASVYATEHSVMCMGRELKEMETLIRLMEELYPTGIVSIVSDTWDFWQVITDYSRRLKDRIMARDGKVVFRPDSGDPVNIICGDLLAPLGTPERKGAIQCLWDVFDGTITDTGYKMLDSHVGLIYGDAITLARADEIMGRLQAMGFASGNVVLGVGSYTYQHVTRDNHGSAVKATSGVVNGERREIFKDPKTDDGTKKSAKGLLRVEKENGTYVLYDQQTEAQEKQGELKEVFRNSKLLIEHTLAEIRARLEAEL